MGKVLRSNKYCRQQLDVLEMMELGCTYADCKHCGHNENVWRYRMRLIHTYGLTKCDDGLYRFIIPTTRRGWTKNGSKNA